MSSHNDITVPFVPQAPPILSQATPQIQLSLSEFQKLIPPPTPVPPQVKHNPFLIGISLLMSAVVVFGSGFGTRWWMEYELQAKTRAGVVGSSFDDLNLPEEITIFAADPPKMITAETRGLLVQWQTLDADLVAQNMPPKAVSIWSMKPGEYRLQAYTSVNNLATPLVNVRVKVVEKKNEKSK